MNSKNYTPINIDNIDNIDKRILRYLKDNKIYHKIIYNAPFLYSIYKGRRAVIYSLENYQLQCILTYLFKGNVIDGHIKIPCDIIYLFNEQFKLYQFAFNKAYHENINIRFVNDPYFDNILNNILYINQSIRSLLDNIKVLCSNDNSKEKQTLLNNIRNQVSFNDILINQYKINNKIDFDLPF